MSDPTARGLGARLAGALRARLLGRPPRSPHAAEPLAGPLGPPVLRPGGPASGPPVGWPAGWAGVEDRAAHRLGGFAELARRHAAGDPEAGARAVVGLAAWLAQDRPGEGPAWAHASDAAARLLHLAAGFGWLGEAAPPSLREAAAGSAAWHVRQLQARLPLGRDDGHRRVAHHAGIVVGALTFPAIPGARAAWAESASALGPALAALTFPDGSDAGGAPRWMEQSWLYAAVALAAARANGVALPGEATAAFARGARFLAGLAAGLPELPPLGEAPPASLLAAPGSAAATLAALSAAWGFDSADAPPPPDRRLAWFGLADGVAPEAVAGRGTGPWWSVWAWHEDGLAVARATVRGEPMRVVLAAQTRSGGPFAQRTPLQLLVDVGGRALLTGAAAAGGPAPSGNGLAPGGPAAARLDVARVDGKKARLEGHQPRGGAARWAREVKLDQQRVRVTDRLEGTAGAVSLRWTFGPDWAVEGAERSWTLRGGPHEVRVELPAGLTWRREGDAWVGEGTLAPGAELRSDFEVR